MLQQYCILQWAIKSNSLPTVVVSTTNNSSCQQRATAAKFSLLRLLE